MGVRPSHRSLGNPPGTTHPKKNASSCSTSHQLSVAPQEGWALEGTSLHLSELLAELILDTTPKVQGTSLKRKAERIQEPEDGRSIVKDSFQGVTWLSHSGIYSYCGYLPSNFLALSSMLMILKALAKTSVHREDGLQGT